MKSNPRLSFLDLLCMRQDRILFEGLSAHIYPGDIIQVKGANGAGKTSLLRIAAGLMAPTEGEVHFNSESITDVREEYYEDLLFIGHSPGVKSELTSEENLSLSLALRGYTAVNEDVLLDQVGLYGFEDSLVGHLSAGQTRRVALAQLWHTSAAVWILDEPFTAIDVEGVSALEQQILSHAKAGGCVLMTTHQALSFSEEQYKVLHLGEG